MSGWQVGDLALCIKVGDWRGAKTGKPFKPGSVRSGGIYTVSHVSPGLASAVALMFVEEPRKRFDASRFRKVTPPKADEFDREVIEHLTGAPVKEKA